MEDEMTIKKNECGERVFVVRLDEEAKADWESQAMRSIIKTGILMGAESNACTKYEIWRDAECVSQGDVGEDFMVWGLEAP